MQPEDSGAACEEGLGTVASQKMLTFDACKPLPNQHLCPSPDTLSAFHIRAVAAAGLPNPALLVFLAQTNERTPTTACANPANETPHPGFVTSFQKFSRTRHRNPSDDGVRIEGSASGQAGGGG